MAPRDLRAFLDASLRQLQRETPPAYAALCDTMRGLRVLVAGSGPDFTVSFSECEASVGNVTGEEPIRLRVTDAAMMALLDGALTLEQSLYADGLVVHAAVPDAARLFDGLHVYLRGGIRCPSFPELLDQFRSSCSRSADTWA